VSRRVPRGLGSVYKEKDKTGTRRTVWRAEKWVTLPDGTVKRVIGRGKTRDEALKRRARKEGELMRSHPDAARLTIEDFLERWIASKRDTLKPNTEREYNRIIKHTNDIIGSVPLARVTPLHIQRVMDAHPPPTANAIRRYLMGAFRQAERWELLNFNPVRNIEPVKRPPPRRKVMQPDEIQEFLKHAPKVYRALFMTAIFAGLRRGELMALPWENVSPESIIVDRTWTRGGVVGTPKTHASYRAVPIHESLYETIRREREGREYSQLAFPPRRRGQMNGTEMLSDGNLGRAFRDTLEKSKVTNLRLHDLRRTAATLWALQGHGPSVIQRLLGHSTPHLALAVYTDVMRGQLESAALNPTAILGGNIGGLKSTPNGTNPNQGERVASDERAGDDAD